MRPIDADAYAAELWKLRENYQMLDDTHTADKIMHGIYRAEQALKEQPTLDVAPVVHGEWFEEDRNYLDESHLSNYFCSRCGKICGVWRRGLQADQLPNYCGNCGAKMDGKEKTDADN